MNINYLNVDCVTFHETKEAHSLSVAYVEYPDRYFVMAYVESITTMIQVTLVRDGGEAVTYFEEHCKAEATAVSCPDDGVLSLILPPIA